LKVERYNGYAQLIAIFQLKPHGLVQLPDLSILTANTPESISRLAPGSDSNFLE